MLRRSFRLKKVKQGRCPLITDKFSDINERYALEGIIGSGKYGTVRKCLDRKTDEPYAVKTIRKRGVENELHDLRNEVTILQQVDHPNIVKLIDLYEDDKDIHIITELFTGGEVYDNVVDRIGSMEGLFTEEDSVRIVAQALDAIAFCHDVLHVVHRDIRPENIVFQDETIDAPIKIIDFGLSHSYGQTDPDGKLDRIIGTSYYAAPEIWNGSYTSKVDIWSIGIIAYFFMCGYAPFNGENDFEVVEQVQNAELEFPSNEWEHISDDAKNFLSSLLQKDPDNRPTAGEALQHPWIIEYRGPYVPPSSATDSSSDHIEPFVPKKQNSFRKLIQKIKRKTKSLPLSSQTIGATAA